LHDFIVKQVIAPRWGAATLVVSRYLIRPPAVQKFENRLLGPTISFQQLATEPRSLKVNTWTRTRVQFYFRQVVHSKSYNCEFRSAAEKQ
jgi:hypothetical protein